MRRKNVYRLYLHDECPRIGSGWRLVQPRFGRKWVYLTEAATEATGRISIKCWLELSETGYPVGKTGRRAA
jgi:hypothetical protein